ncbi:MULTISPECIES: fumarylacetoacetate hydrolase family protein [Sphingobium]|jgi:fumarylacetoacetate (FAA) hydrolase family protein|uniref:fumarylacetoacetate hydrolase family protein n=1 Tax=Sphingobium TaxID=165695 RepID=UPI000C5720C2|nr:MULTISPECIES: fumarylacetoacetate hydrolase family protein [Sphingobium]MBA38533.1 fumarylacetoacetate hydrolase [Sphingobium sp.]MEC9017274.1 fumarylacetoacetate hydrolase family protein [Pseudomonadota bacterium]MBS49673.1 fumarylacetoacetate hydrolase [Sphingobium sp.]MCC4254954.1 fumarylacetoacetate hydrolase family protein [Sphingobium lactosutens]MEE2740411.1 fumarylacetoacetate hydrolase family protein [Pseudomonadota bacterium]|tara:strand:+ start:957 stop:2099 length:1143 start_codon:yes stop_codon:yes gene_type:complete
MSGAVSLLDFLPSDWRKGMFFGRVQTAEGPSPILVRDGIAYDMSSVAPTVAQLADMLPLPSNSGRRIGSLDSLSTPLLSPVDLQCVKACGVTFAVSALERVIEERARGDAAAASEIRARLEDRVGGSIRNVVPGTAEAAALKAALIEDGLWSQYLEVAIGPDAEVFTKAPILSSVGPGAPIGIRSDSTWNNPEPEIVLLVNAAGAAIGATLGNDVNLRDFEGRSALLLGKAKDNNASCALGPLIRLFDEDFTIDDVRNAEVELTIDGPEGYRLEGASSMNQISRDPLELVRQTLSEHQYPDGFALFLGTLFAPVQDRDEPGRGFTHKVGDRVAISTPRLGKLVNEVVTSKDAAAWDFGVIALMTNLAARGLLNTQQKDPA